MDVDIWVALIGFFGVSLSIAVSHYWSARKQAQDAAFERVRRNEEAKQFRELREREVEAAEAERRAQAQVTARLLLADLLQAKNRLRLARRAGKYWSPRFTLPLSVWFEHRAIVAQHVEKPEHWESVSRFFRSLGTVELQSQNAHEREGRDPYRPELTNYEANQIDVALKRAVPAREALEEFSQDHSQNEETELETPAAETSGEATPDETTPEPATANAVSETS